MTDSPDKVWIIKTDPDGQETWRYQGSVLERKDHNILVEAFFNRQDLVFHGVEMRENDRFLERYYEDRWYNIFELHDRDDERLKGWYCNVTKPAVFSPGKITYADLALDLLVYPDGRYLVLDQDEFDGLDISTATRQQARDALRQLIELAEQNLLSKAIKPNR